MSDRAHAGGEDLMPWRMRITNTHQGHPARTYSRCANHLFLSRNAFTLLEVMVSLAILATAFAAALRLHSHSMGMLLSSRIHTKAMELAQFKITDIELIGLRNLGLRTGDFGDTAPDYVWEVDLEETPAPSWKRVTVTVRNRHGGTAGVFRLTEYMQEAAPSPASREKG